MKTSITRQNNGTAYSSFRMAIIPGALLLILTCGRIYASVSDPGKGGTGPIKSDIEQVNKMYAWAFMKGDSSLLLSCYTPDACLMPANSPSLCGRDGLLLFYRAAYYRMGMRNITFTSGGLYGQTDDFVTEQGTYEMFDADNKSVGKGKFLVLWKKTAEGWKMFRDMFNSDAPPHAMK